MELCIPLMTEHFEDLCLWREKLMQATPQYFEMMLESEQLKDVSAETMFRAICDWLKAGIDECDLEEKAKTSREVLMIYGYSRVSNSRCLTSVPQLQPGESFNATVPCNGRRTVLDGRLCIVRSDGSESTVMSVGYRDGSISHKSFTTKRREDYAVAWRNESIFIFGGYYNGQSVSTCEKSGIANDRLTQLPGTLSARCRASALNIPEIGIAVVGGNCRDNRQTTGSRYAEVLVEDPRNESGWRWTKLNPMLQARHRPAVAYFKGCVVVAGGDKELSVEYLPLTSIEQTKAQWTRLHAILSNFNGGDAYEFLPTEESKCQRNEEQKVCIGNGSTSEEPSPANRGGGNFR
ncbi:hypothetical protein TSMEX_010764 [Taenia solium]|eukprot:TsM_001142400 transcript=TsM_001142400 gene=TsM_001142400